jgi:hypothetical protein
VRSRGFKMRAWWFLPAFCSDAAGFTLRNAVLMVMRACLSKSAGLLFCPCILVTVVSLSLCKLVVSHPQECGRRCCAVSGGVLFECGLGGLTHTDFSAAEHRGNPAVTDASADV